MAASTGTKDGYILSRDYGANTRQAMHLSTIPDLTLSIRLNLVHYVWQDIFGYLLHPTIATNRQNLKVAEIGVGTGLWLLKASQALPTSTELDGLDISFQSCSPQEWQPSNIFRHTVDVTAEPPSHLLEKYDVIHVQMFYTIVKDGNPAPILRNLIKMLKPGGYISWDEWDSVSSKTVRTSTATASSDDELETLTEYIFSLGHTRPGPVPSTTIWVNRLHEIFRENGLKNVVVDRHTVPKEFRTIVTDAFMVAFLEVVEKVLDTLGGGQGEKARALIAEVSKNRSTTAYSIDGVVTVGQKPEA